MSAADNAGARLEASVDRLGETIREALGEIDRLRESNRELLAALKGVEWTGEGHDRDNCWPCCPSCGAPAANVSVEPDEATADAHPGEHMADCVLAAAIARAEQTATVTGGSALTAVLTRWPWRMSERQPDAVVSDDHKPLGLASVVARDLVSHARAGGPLSNYTDFEADQVVSVFERRITAQLEPVVDAMEHGLETMRTLGLKGVPAGDVAKALSVLRDGS